MLEIEITPVQVFPDTATKLRVPRVEVRQPGENGEALVIWQLLSSKGEPLKDGSVVLQGDDYNSWGSQDDYLLGYVSQKLGMLPAPLATDTPKDDNLESTPSTTEQQSEVSDEVLPSVDPSVEQSQDVVLDTQSPVTPAQTDELDVLSTSSEQATALDTSTV